MDSLYLRKKEDFSIVSKTTMYVLVLSRFFLGWNIGCRFGFIEQATEAQYEQKSSPTTPLK
jgi:hypothetical protein